MATEEALDWLRSHEDRATLPKSVEALAPELNSSKRLIVYRTLNPLLIIGILVKYKIIVVEEEDSDSPEAIVYHLKRAKGVKYRETLQRMKRRDVAFVLAKCVKGFEKASAVNCEKAMAANHEPLPASKQELISFVMERCESVPLPIPADAVIEALEEEGVISVKKLTQKSRGNTIQLFTLKYN